MFYLVPESGTRQKLVPDCMTHVPETGTSFLVPVSGKYVMGINIREMLVSKYYYKSKTKFLYPHKTM